MTNLGQWFDKYGRTIVPNDAQRYVRDLAFHEDITELYVTGGFGSAKTTTGANALLQASITNAEVDNKGRYAIVGNDMAQVRHVMMSVVEGILNGAVGWRGAFRDNPEIVDFNWMAKRMKTPWAEFVWSTGVDGCKSLEGGEFAAIWADEGILYLPEAHRRLRERLRQTGYPVRFLLHTFTPQAGRSLSELNEVCRTLSDVPVNGRARFAMATRWNVDNLPAGYIEQLYSQYSPQMARACLEGEFVILAGLVYPTYTTANQMPYPREGNPNLPISVGLDAGYHRPWAGFFQQFEPGRWVCFDEIAVADMTTEGLAHQIAQAPCMEGRSVVTVCPDPAVRGVQSASGKSDAITITQVLADHGIVARLKFSAHPEDRIVTVRTERVRAALCSYDGKRRLYVAQHLVGQRYRPGSDNQPTVGIDQGLSEQPLKDGSDEPDRGPKWDAWSHACDGLGYFVLAEMPLERVDSAAWERAMGIDQTTAPM